MILIFSTINTVDSLQNGSHTARPVEDRSRLRSAQRQQRALRAVDSVTPPSVVIDVSASETDRAMFSADRNHGDVNVTPWETHGIQR